MLKCEDCKFCDQNELGNFLNVNCSLKRVGINEKDKTCIKIETKEKNTSAVDHPNHYAQGRKYEPIAVIRDWQLSFSLGNALKYISRAGRKDKDKIIEDLEKAIWYIQEEIEYQKSLKNK